MSYLWNILLYHPLVNAMAFLVSIIPGGDVGIAVIILTILVKLVIFPLSQHSIRNQAAMNMLAPELNKIKASGASKEEQARLTMELYKKHKTNPFSGCLVLIPTIVIIIALYRVFYKGINFDPAIIYSFVHLPSHINTMFLGIIDVGQKSLILAALAGVSQYFQAYYMPKPPQSNSASTGGADSFQDSFAKSMNMQMKYVFPFIIALIVYRSGIVALYFITSNIFAVAQQIYVKKTEKKVLDEEVDKSIKLKV